MLFTMRFYKRHDMDLIYLADTPGIIMQDVARKALIAYYKGAFFKFSAPPNKGFKEPEKGYVQMKLALSDKDAPGIESWIEGFKKGTRNSAFKNILRFYLSCPCIAPYRSDDWEEPFLEENERIRQIKIGDRKKRTIEKKKIDTEAWLKSIAEMGATGDPHRDVKIKNDGILDPKKPETVPEDDFALDESFEKLLEGGSD